MKRIMCLSIFILTFSLSVVLGQARNTTASEASDQYILIARLVKSNELLKEQVKSLQSQIDMCAVEACHQNDDENITSAFNVGMAFGLLAGLLIYILYRIFLT